MPNRLATETSPYLLQHAENPVEWYPWGPEALERARQEDKPILLSIGYAACHWCHVMAHESFEDESTALLMNEHFVNIKVDREERPDLDSIYMHAVQALTGHGGWPMTVFLTPEAVPFYGGTYFPPEDRHGIPSFSRILKSIAGAYKEQRGKVSETVAAMHRLYGATSARQHEAQTPGARTLELAYRALSREYDVANGGFGGAPKFPPTMSLEFLLRYWRRTGSADALRMVRETFVRMARGGIFDQIGGGLARYSVDARWMVPHFEKMLYDNALLIRLGARLYQATGDAEVRLATEQTIDWARRELCSPEGAFYSSYDADSDGEEGLFYVWTQEEFDSVLGDAAPLLREYFGVTPDGNFEGRNILHRRSGDDVAVARAGMSSDELAAMVAGARTRLLEERAKRVWPGRDDKIIASWNGLMVRALADAASAFSNDSYAAMSLRCATFLFDALAANTTADADDLRVFRTFNRGEARIMGFLEDHAALGLAALSVYGLTFDEIWLRRAFALAQSCNKYFWVDTEAGGQPDAGAFHDTASDAEALITRPRDISDNAIPSGNSMAAELLILTAEYSDDDTARQRATSVIGALADSMATHPNAFGHLLCAADSLLNGTLQLALVGRDARRSNPMLAAAAGVYIPALVAAAGDGAASALPLLSGKAELNGSLTAYLCRRYLCESPTNSPDELRTQIDRAFSGAVGAGSAQ